jgi:very-short-patch-repair endonuclease
MLVKKKVKRKVERDKSKYLTYEDLKEYVKKNNILTKDQYINHVSTTYIVDGKNIPYNPNTFYSKEIWEGWSLFLRGVIYKKNYNGTYYSYLECKKAIIKYNFTSKDNFLKRIKDIIKEDIRIPYSPSTIYKKEWEGWIEFLDTDNYIEQIEKLVDFEIARDYARSLNLKLSKQWASIKFSDLPKGMTKKPYKLYKEKGWIDWYDFLGIDKKSNMSHGEVLISNFLDENKIKYNYNKSLKDCISSSKLRFDFYLTEYNICIEFDGIQHFFPCEMFGGEEEFQKLKIRDSIKNEWCSVNGIKLIRFKYNQKKDEIESLLRKELKLNKLLNE